MQIYKAVVIVFLCEIGIILSNGEELQLPLDIEEESNEELHRPKKNCTNQFTGGLLNNIATIRLEHPVTLNRYVQPIRLPRLSDTRTFEMMEGTSPGLEYNGTMRYLRNQI
uniref:Uncharacterized protein n=1 Tax=Anopheles coluzzii TaxID=1518534 RepID=A0A8W7PW39_ANOCL